MTIKNVYTSNKLNIDIDQIIYTIGSYHYNWHKEIELLWLLAGKIEVNIEGEIYFLNEDDLIALNSNSGHATLALAPDSIAMRLHLSPDFFTEQGMDVTKGAFLLNSTKDKQNPLYAELRHGLAKLHLAFLEGALPFQIHSTYFRITELLSSFYHENDELKSRYSQGQRTGSIDRAIRHIEKNFKEELNLEELAEKFNYSSSYLSKLFKTELGINFYEYLIRCRLQHAVSDLGGERKIADIAMENGFSDVRAFNKMFRRHFGATPSEYRSQLKESSQDLKGQFKRALNDLQTQMVLTKLQTICSEGAGNLQDSPCEECQAKSFEKKYFTLMESLKEITKE